MEKELVAIDVMRVIHTLSVIIEPMHQEVTSLKKIPQYLYVAEWMENYCDALDLVLDALIRIEESLEEKEENVS